MTTASTRLRELLSSQASTLLMEAHNGLVAKLAEEAGFEALWASGLAISASLGVRDCNEASWTQVLEVLEFIADATALPVLLDGDTGYGNFNNARRLVRKLEQRGVAGVCLEDKLFPKTNSFIGGERQELAQVDEFQGKLRAVKDTQRDADFVLVARTEAFIAGWGLEEALLRAHAYADAGADALLVHSKRRDAEEVLAFMEHWTRPVPIVVVPTKYPSVPLSSLEAAGVKSFIFANQSIRTVISAVRTNLQRLRRTASLSSIEGEIASVEEIFRLQNVAELQRCEARYLAPSRRRPSALLLGASRGDFAGLAPGKPKCMLRLRGRPVLSWQAEALRRQGIQELAAVRGFAKGEVDLPGIRYFDNDHHATTGECRSLEAASEFLSGDVLVSYGDVLVDDQVLASLLTCKDPITIVADAAWQYRGRSHKARDLVRCERRYSSFGGPPCRLQAIGETVAEQDASGEFVGLMLLRGEGAEVVRAALGSMRERDAQGFASANLEQLFERLIADGMAPAVHYTYGRWRDLDDASDLEAWDAAG